MALDAEKIIIGYLLEQSAITTITQEVVGDTPSKVANPFARVTLFGDPTVVDTAEWLLEVTLQIDCYSGTKANNQGTASRLSLAVRAALEAMPDAELEGVVITKTKASRRRNNDRAYTPPMQGYAVSATVHMHP